MRTSRQFNNVTLVLILIPLCFEIHVLVSTFKLSLESLTGLLVAKSISPQTAVDWPPTLSRF